jgi:hypothetical protein
VTGAPVGGDRNDALNGASGLAAGSGATVRLRTGNEQDLSKLGRVLGPPEIRSVGTVDNMAMVSVFHRDDGTEFAVRPLTVMPQGTLLELLCAPPLLPHGA